MSLLFRHRRTSADHSLAAPIHPPSAQTSSPFLYVSNSGSSSVSGFAIDPNTGALTEVAGSSFPTPTPIRLARDGSGKYLTVANGNLTNGFPGGLSYRTRSITGALSDLHCIDKESPGNLPCYPLVPNTHGTPQFVAANGETIYIGRCRFQRRLCLLTRPKQR